MRFNPVWDASKFRPMSGSATLATERFRLATPATRISAPSTSGARSGLPPVAVVALVAPVDPDVTGWLPVRHGLGCYGRHGWIGGRRGGLRHRRNECPRAARGWPGDLGPTPLGVPPGSPLASLTPLARLTRRFVSPAVPGRGAR